MQLDDLKILICDDSILARKQMKDIINSIGSPTIIEATKRNKPPKNS
jgi:two-component system chemotaxis response regulator CheY